MKIVIMKKKVHKSMTKFKTRILKIQKIKDLV